MYLQWESRTVSQITGYSLEETLTVAIPLLHPSIKGSTSGDCLDSSKVGSSRGSRESGLEIRVRRCSGR